jgi:hypothetical protein
MAQIISHPDGTQHYYGYTCPNNQCDGFGNPPVNYAVNLPSVQDIGNMSVEGARRRQAIADQAIFGVQFTGADSINKYYDSQSVGNVRTTPEWRASYEKDFGLFGAEGAALRADTMTSALYGNQGSFQNTDAGKVNRDRASAEQYRINAAVDAVNADPYSVAKRFARSTGTAALYPATNAAGQITGIESFGAGIPFSADPSNRQMQGWQLTNSPDAVSKALMVQVLSPTVAAATTAADARMSTAALNAVTASAQLTAKMDAERDRQTARAAQNALDREAAQTRAETAAWRAGGANVPSRYTAAPGLYVHKNP